MKISAMGLEQLSTPKNNSLWDGCFGLVTAASWQPSDEKGFSHQRSAWWSEISDDRIAQYNLIAQASRKGFFQRRKADIYQLTSAVETDPEVREFSRYFIVKEGLYKVLHSCMAVNESGMLTKEDEQAICESHDFALDHGLAEPSEDDLSMVKKILSIGLIDGVHPNLIGGKGR